MPNGFSTCVTAVSCMISGGCRWRTHNDPRDTVLRIAVALQVLRDCNEHTGRESHVKYPVGLLATLLELPQVLFELLERLVLIVLAGDVRAEAAELFQLLLQFLCWCFDVGLDALEILVVVHLRPRISDDANVFWEEVVSVLFRWSTEKRGSKCATYEAEERWELDYRSVRQVAM